MCTRIRRRPTAKLISPTASTSPSRHDVGVFLGDDLLAWLVLALGGALFVGNVVAVVRPPQGPRQAGDLDEAPRARSLAMAALGLVGAVWALATLVTG